MFDFRQNFFDYSQLVLAQKPRHDSTQPSINYLKKLFSSSLGISRHFKAFYFPKAYSLKTLQPTPCLALLKAYPTVPQNLGEI